MNERSAVVVSMVSISVVIRRRNKKNKGTSPIERGGVCVSRSTNSTYRVSASMPVFPQGYVDYKIELHT